MQQVVILGFDGALASAITGVVDLFAMAGVSWNRIQQQDVQRLFKVRIASQMDSQFVVLMVWNCKLIVRIKRFKQQIFW